MIVDEITEEMIGIENRIGLLFDGIDDYVETGNVINLGSSFTIGVYIREWRGDVIAPIVCATESSAVIPYYKVFIGKLSSLDVGIKFAVTTNDLTHPSYFVVENSFVKEKFIVGIVDNILMKSYLDNQVVFSHSINPVISNEYKIRLNSYYNNGKNYMIIDSVIIYNKALTDEEIEQVYEYLKYGRGSIPKDGLVLWLDGDSIGDDGIWYDKSGNGNNGVIYGARKISSLKEVD